MKRGDIRWYTLEPPDKRRPVLVLTRDSAIGVLNTVTVAPVTSTMRVIRPKSCWTEPMACPLHCAVNLDHIQTIPKNKVGALLTTLSNHRMAQAKAGAVDFALGFDEGGVREHGSLDRRKISEESQAYQQHHAEMKAQYMGQYIALHNGQVVDHDMDVAVLRQRVRQRFGRKPVMITLVEEEAERPLVRHGFCSWRLPGHETPYCSRQVLSWAV